MADPLTTIQRLMSLAMGSSFEEERRNAAVQAVKLIIEKKVVLTLPGRAAPEPPRGFDGGHPNAVSDLADLFRRAGIDGSDFFGTDFPGFSSRGVRPHREPTRPQPKPKRPTPPPQPPPADHIKGDPFGQWVETRVMGEVVVNGKTYMVEVCKENNFCYLCGRMISAGTPSYYRDGYKHVSCARVDIE